MNLTAADVLAASSVGLLAAAGMAYASIPAPDGTIHGCYAKADSLIPRVSRTTRATFGSSTRAPRASPTNSPCPGTSRAPRGTSAPRDRKDRRD
jgi:hypothetical protein